MGKLKFGKLKFKGENIQYPTPNIQLQIKRTRLATREGKSGRHHTIVVFVEN